MSNSVNHKIPERKSRRTHKNSRDGCPNCKAKRIKCSEELPACHNCVKKNYRCGYFDFPKEKLEHLRKKNQKKILEQPQQVHYLPAHQKPQQGIISQDTLSQSPQSYVNETNSEIKINGGLEERRILPQESQSTLIPKISQIDPGNPQTWNPMNDRINRQSGSVNPNYHELNNEHENVLDSSNIQSVAPTSFIPNHQNYYGNQHQQAYLQSIMHEPIVDVDSRINSQKEELVHAVIWESFNCLLDPPNANFDPLTDTSKAGVDEIFDFNNIKVSFNNLIKSNTDASMNNNITEKSGSFIVNQSSGNFGNNSSFKKEINLNPLPNAVIGRYVFPKLEKKGNEFVNRYLQITPLRLKELTNYNFEVTFSPIWHNSEYERIWTSVYKQAEILSIYFCFFIERSLNVLIKKYNSSIGVDSFSNESLDSELSDHSVSPSSSIFSSKDLILLTRISYFYYGDLIKAIRESLTKINIEYSTKISLFSSWSTFLQLHGSVETLCLMLSGTSSLLSKIVNEAQLYQEITPTIRFILNLFNDHTSFCLVPDYNFSVIEDLYDELREFKSFCYNNQNLTSAKNAMVVMNLLQLEHFLKSLTNHYYPKIKRINEYYKNLNNIHDETNNIYCTSFTLLFELLVEWFDVIPSELKSLNSKATPLRKTFYLFFTAIGKSLINVFSPIRTLMLVDLCDMFFPKAEIDYSLYHFEKKQLTDVQYNHLSRLSIKLMRTISFFNNRLSLYAYHLANTTVLNKEYVQFFREAAKVTEYKDTISLLPQKLKVNELMLDKFTLDESLKYCHYPNFDIFKQHNFSKYTIDPSFETTDAIGKFNISLGIFPSDYDATLLITEYRRFTKRIWMATKIPVEDARHKMHIFHSGRNEISRGVKFNLYGESS